MAALAAMIATVSAAHIPQHRASRSGDSSQSSPSDHAATTDSSRLPTNSATISTANTPSIGNMVVAVVAPNR